LERVGSEASGAPCYDGGSVMRHDQHAFGKKERERRREKELDKHR
jgi:hypothetical protein